MQKFKITDFEKGWVIGDFKPALLTTKDFEVAVKYHKGGEEYKPHYQEVATEYNVLVSGWMRVNEEDLSPGDVFVFEPKEVAFPKFITDVIVLVVKVPSLPNDKIEVKNPE